MYCSKKAEALGHTKVAFLLLTPQHTNFGDHAIAFSEIQFLSNQKYYVVEITGKKLITLLRYPKLVKNLIAKHQIFINGGGNLGTLWFDDAEMLMRIEALEQRNNFIQQSPNRKLREYSHIYLMDNLIWDYTVILHYVKDRHELRDIKSKYNYLYLQLKSICSKNNVMYLAKKNEFYVFYISPFLFRAIRKVRHIFHK